MRNGPNGAWRQAIRTADAKDYDKNAECALDHQSAFSMSDVFMRLSFDVYE